MSRTDFTVIGRLVSEQRLLVYGSALRLRVSVCFNLKGTERQTAAAAAAAAACVFKRGRSGDGSDM